MTPALYVVHGGRRYAVTGETSLDGDAAFELAPIGKLGRVNGARIVARVKECREDRRHVVIRGYSPHRLSRAVVLDVRQEKGETRLSLRLKGMRRAFTLTLEGAYDLAAQSAANVEKRERQWKRQQQRLGRSA